MNMENANVASEPNFPEVPILYEDEHLLAVNKPAGLVVHADGRTIEPSLSDWVREKYPELKEVGGMHTLDSERYAPRMGILHRLDRETSGVILIAKDDETFYFLQRQFLDHTIEKIYYAFVKGIPEPREGVIEFPIGRSRSDFRRWTTGSDARGTLRPATTFYKMIGTDDAHALLELRPKTGRTHQLRVHLLAIGHPILADTRYGTPSGLEFTRLALHARTLSFTTPDGKRRTIDAPFPLDFASLVAKFGGVC